MDILFNSVSSTVCTVCTNPFAVGGIAVVLIGGYFVYKAFCKHCEKEIEIARIRANVEIREIKAKVDEEKIKADLELEKVKANLEIEKTKADLEKAKMKAELEKLNLELMMKREELSGFRFVGLPLSSARIQQPPLTDE